MLNLMDSKFVENVVKCCKKVSLTTFLLTAQSVNLELTTNGYKQSLTTQWPKILHLWSLKIY